MTPADYEEVPPDENKVQKFFRWGTQYLPPFLRDDSSFAIWFTDVIWIDCAYCLAMRGVFIGFFLGVSCALLTILLIVGVA